MAGIGRIVLGVICLLLGVAFALTIIGVLFGVFLLFVGLILLGSGTSARSHEARMIAQQQQTNYLLQQQLAMQASAPPTAYPMGPPAADYSSGPPPGAPPAERYCPVCGQGNARSAGFCQRCGRALPPPP